MKFEFSDAWLLQSIKFSENDDNGATLTDIVKVGDYTNRAIITYSELTNGTKKLVTVGLVIDKDKKLFTTERLKEWWTKKFDGKRKIGIHKGQEEIEKYLNKQYGTVDEQWASVTTQFTETDLDKSTKEYTKWFKDVVESMNKKKGIKR